MPRPARDSGPPAARVFTGNFIRLCLANFFVFISMYFLLVTLPLYAVHRGGNEAEAGLVIGAFSIAALAARPFVGRGVDTWGRKRLIVLGALGMVLAAALFQVATSVPSILAVRLLHGLAWGAFGTALATLLADIVPPTRRGEAMGYYGISTNLAMSFGPALSIYLLHVFDFPVVFAGSAALALAGLALAWTLHDPFVRATAKPGAGMTIVERSALFPSTIQCLSGLTYAAIVTFIPLFAAQKDLGNAGLFFAVFSVVVIITRGPLGRLSDRRGRATVLLPGLAMTALGLAVLSRSNGLPVFLGSALLYGIGFAAVFPALMALVADRASPDRRGAAMGTLTAFMDVGISAGALLWGAVAQASSYSTMFLASAAIPLVAMAAYVAGSRRERRATEPRR